MISWPTHRGTGVDRRVTNLPVKPLAPASIDCPRRKAEARGVQLVGSFSAIPNLTKGTGAFYPFGGFSASRWLATMVPKEQ